MLRSPYQLQPRKPLPKGARPPQDSLTEMGQFLPLAQEVLKAHAEMKKMHAEITAHIASVARGPQGPMGPAGTGGRDGESADHEKIVADVLKKIPKPRHGKDGKTIRGIDGKNPDPAEVVALIKEKKMLSVEHIAGLESHIASVRNAAAMRGGEGEWKVKTLTGAINGSNKVFTASASGRPNPNSHHLVLNYVEQNPLADYTLSYAAGIITITYTTAPDTSLSGLPHYLRWL